MTHYPVLHGKDGGEPLYIFQEKEIMAGTKTKYNIKVCLGLV